MSRRSRSYYRKKYGKKKKSDDMIIYLAAIVTLVIFIWSVTRYLNNKNSEKEISAALSNVASFQIPYKTFEQLYELSIIKNLKFTDVLSIYSIEKNFFPSKSVVTPTEIELNEYIINYASIKAGYNQKKVKPYYDLLNNIIEEIKYFPLPYGYDDYAYSDSYGAKREYGGERTHEGCDIMDRDNITGRIPVVSMTDGVVEQAGWNERGGYRIGVRSNNGNYYYYAHFDSFADGMEKGKKIKAGELLGFMGDTGYSKTEGTRGNFPVHLHVGISPETTLTNKDFWINPYIFLRFAERTKVVI